LLAELHGRLVLAIHLDTSFSRPIESITLATYAGADERVRSHARARRVLKVSNADRVVFPAIGRTKGDVVAYYERIAKKALPHLLDRPLSIKRFPKGLAGAGFFQKNVPKHYPSSFGHLDVPRQEGGVTTYPVVREAEHLPYLANQGAIELHVTTARVLELDTPDRIIIDLDPPPGAIAMVRQAAFHVKDLFEGFGLAVTPVATGSKGYHLVARIRPTDLGDTLHHAAALFAHSHPDVMTIAFKIAARGKRVFVDWLRNRVMATAVAPYSLRARPNASVATPLTWAELETTAPDAFTIDDLERLLDRPDPLLEQKPADPKPFMNAVQTAFEASGLVLEKFDRFRS
jgi:bifunctional non-homologous end joining protein LigD